MLKKGGMFWTIVIIIVIFGIIDVYLLYNKYYVSNNNSENDINNLLVNTDNTDIISNETNNSTENNTGGSGGGAGAGGTGSSETPSNVSCDGQVAYSLEYLDVIETCNQEVNGECLNKKVDCSLTVTNLDEQISGVFEIRFYFLEKGDRNDESFASVKVSDIIYAKSYNIFKANKLITESENGLANKTISCGFDTIRVPEKNIC